MTTWYSIEYMPPKDMTLLMTGVNPGSDRWFALCVFNGVVVYNIETGDDIFQFRCPTHWSLFDGPDHRVP